MANEARKLDLNWAQAVGSALAALSSAVLLSTLGATGTLIGAAVGSVVVTVGGTVYSHYLSVSRERMTAARSAALRASSVGRGIHFASRRRSLDSVARTVAQAPERFPLLAGSVQISGPPRPDDRAAGTSWRDALRGLRWRPALATSLGLFVLVMGLIVSMELVTGRALSSYTGGSSADGPRTSISLLGSTTDGRDSKSTDTTDRGGRVDETGGRTVDRRPDGSASHGAVRGAGEDRGGSGPEVPSDADAPQPGGSTTGPGQGTATEPTVEPGTDTAPEPAPQPIPDTSPEPGPQTPTTPVPAPEAPAAETPAS